MKPFFSNKGLNSSKLMIKEENLLITQEKELANVMSTFFVTITENVDLRKNADSSLINNYSENINDILKNINIIPEYIELVKLL